MKLKERDTGIIKEFHKGENGYLPEGVYDIIDFNDMDSISLRGAGIGKTKVYSDGKLTVQEKSKHE